MRRHVQVARIPARDLDHTRVPAHDHRASICLARHRLHSADRARRQVLHRAAERDRARVRNAQPQPAVGGQPVRASALRAQLRRREAKRLEHHAVHLAHAAKARRRRDDGHRQVRLVEQPARKVRAPRPGDEVRRRAQLRQEQPPKMSLAGR